MGAGSQQRTRRRLRCAIYTRKSSDEGLEQSFNSLVAQRDACEAFIVSQKHEGWVALPTPYDDGGFSGGSLQRPALQQLLHDIGRGSVDAVVVYKVDRLTRSLADFAKLTELFDRHCASFVSVTQQFNTTTSMGRLTLNVLLSFAQFEREVAGERIRDKIALSKRRGMWMGGLPPHGYDGINGKLEVNPVEAETVRQIFQRYLEVGSIAELKRSLDADGIVSKRRIFRNGRQAGGVPLSRGAIYQILRNHLYRGRIAHRGEVHTGNHSSIVAEDLWLAVQERLSADGRRARGVKPVSGENALLGGRIFDGNGNRMTPTYAVKRGRRYRYYVSAPLVRGGHTAGALRVPAADIETIVRSQIAAHLGDSVWVAGLLSGGEQLRSVGRLIESTVDLAKLISSRQEGDDHGSSSETLPRLVSRVTVSSQTVSIALDRSFLFQALPELPKDLRQALSSSDGPLEIAVPATILRHGKQVRMVLGEIASKTRSPDPALVQLVADARRWFEDLRTGQIATIAEVAARERQQVSHVSRTLPLAFLAPDIVEMILDGRQPPALTSQRLKSRRRPLPMSWAEQRALLANLGEAGAGLKHLLTLPHHE